MKAEYKRDLQHNYLILEIPGDAEENNYRLQMIEKNKIAGLLSFHSSRKDGVLQLYYEITSMQPLDSVFEKKAMGYQDIIFVLSGIRNTLEELQKYLLNAAQVIFEPKYVFIGPGRRNIELCYIPGTQNDAPITVLAEYILKRLDHEDRQAVMIGYSFYQRTLEENFSLQKALADILSSVKQEKAHWRDNAEIAEDHALERKAGQSAHEDLNEIPGNQSKDAEECFQENKDVYEVIHKERRKHPGRDPGKLFSVIHPAVLLSGLFLTAVLEMIFYFGYLNLTEAGGIFFLLISVEMLINRCWRNRKERKKQEENRWVTEEEDEMYKILREEMYEAPPEDTKIEETRCLLPSSGNSGMSLVCLSSDPLNRYPNITVEREMTCVGKIKGESDVILDSPTVSRMHARLICRKGIYYIKDLNSKNGTFCNGERLRPQEERQLAKGDVVAFAEIEYRVARI